MTHYCVKWLAILCQIILMYLLIWKCVKWVKVSVDRNMTRKPELSPTYKSVRKRRHENAVAWRHVVSLLRPLPLNKWYIACLARHRFSEKTNAIWNSKENVESSLSLNHQTAKHCARSGPPFSLAVAKSSSQTPNAHSSGSHAQTQKHIKRDATTK